MEVILLERVGRLGKIGDIVKVRDGYARNFLLPQNKALRATANNKAAFEADRARIEEDNKARRADAETVAKDLTGLKVIMVRAAGESGQLYGSVSSRDISDAVTEAGIAITRNQVVMNRALKTIGLHDVEIMLHPEVVETVVINIARSPEEAAVQFELGSAVVADDKFESDFESTFGQDEEGFEAAEEATEEETPAEA